MPKPLKRISDEEFYALIANAAPFEAVIKSAIVIETEIEAIFQVAFIDPAALAQMNMTYAQKVSLLVALGLQARFLPPLRALAKMRNEFAHRLDAKFDKNDADNFYSTFAKEDKKVIANVLRELPNNEITAGKPRQFSEFDEREKLSLCVVTLRAAIVSARKQTNRLLGSGGPGETAQP